MLLAVISVFGAAVPDADAQQVARGIFFRLGEKLVTELTPAGDTDTFVCYGVAGVKISITLKAKTSGFAPTMTLLDADMNELATAAFTKVKTGKIKLRKFPLPDTGAYFVRVTDPLDRAGRYELKTKGKLRDVPGYAPVTLNPTETHDITFGAGRGLEVSVKLKPDSRTKVIAVQSVYDPDGEEMPHGIGGFIKVSKGFRASLLMRSSARSSWRDDSDPRRLGTYGIRIGGTTTATTVKIKVEVRHPKVKGTRVISSDLPEVTSLDPAFGRPGTDLVVHGANFLEGEVQVLFGDTYGREATRLSATTIGVKAPFGAGEVDVTVISSDGQEGTLEDAFIFIPLPPNVQAVSPTIGPNSGGTVVDVVGDRMTYVTKVTLDGTDLQGAVTIVTDSMLRFTTEAMAAGIYTITVTDQFGQSSTLSDAFEMFAPPVLSSIDPTLATFAGGDVVDCVGQDFRNDSVVLLDGVPTTATHMSSTHKRFTTPSGTIGDKLDVGIRDIWGRTSTIVDAFEYADGRFRDLSAGMPANTSSRFAGGTAIALGDIDKDGDVDAVIGRSVSSGSTYQTWVLKNNGAYGAGTVELPYPQKGYARFYSPYPGNADVWQATSIALGDLDDDEDLDLVVTSDKDFDFQRSTYYWTYSVTYTYWTYRYYASGIPMPSTRVLLNNGTGTFTLSSSAVPDPRTSGQDSDTLLGSSVVLGDIDGDGDLDMILSLQEAIQETSYSYSYNVTYYWGIAFNYYFYWYLNDGDDRSATRVFLNNGSAKFTDATATKMPDVSDGDLFAANASALVDVDDDGDLDLVVTGEHADLRDSGEAEYVSGSKTRVLLNNGSGVFTNATSTWFPSTKAGDDWGGGCLSAADLDGNDYPEIVLCTAKTLMTGGGVYLSSMRLFSNGGSKFTEATSSKLPAVRTDGNGEMFRATAVVLVNANSDPAIDIVIVDEAVVMAQDPGTGLFTQQVSSTRVLRNDGSGGFTDDTLQSMPIPGTDKFLASAVALGDMDGDGDNDMLITTDHSLYTGIGKKPSRLFEFR